MMLIRAAQAHDHVVLVRFNVELAHETEQLQLDVDRVSLGVAAVLSDPNKGTYLVCEIEGHVVGALMLTQEWSDWHNGQHWWVQSVFVVPHRRGRGVFRALYATAQQQAKAAEAVSLRLYVEPHNEAAIATYRRLGMAARYTVMQAR